IVEDAGRREPRALRDRGGVIIVGARAEVHGQGGDRGAAARVVQVRVVATVVDLDRVGVGVGVVARAAHDDEGQVQHAVARGGRGGRGEGGGGVGQRDGGVREGRAVDAREGRHALVVERAHLRRHGGAAVHLAHQERGQRGVLEEQRAVRGGEDALVREGGGRRRVDEGQQRGAPLRGEGGRLRRDAGAQRGVDGLADGPVEREDRRVQRRRAGERRVRVGVARAQERRVRHGGDARLARGERGEGRGRRGGEGACLGHLGGRRRQPERPRGGGEEQERDEEQAARGKGHGGVASRRPMARETRERCPRPRRGRHL